MVLVSLLSADGMGNRAISACGAVLLCRLAGDLLLLLLLKEVVLPVELLPLRIHVCLSDQERRRCEADSSSKIAVRQKVKP